MIFVSLILLLVTLGNAATVIRTSRNGFIVSVNYVRNNPFPRYSGTARIDLQSLVDFETELSPLYTPTSDLANGITFGETGHYLGFRSPRRFLSRFEMIDVPAAEFCPQLRIGAGPNSVFIETFPSFVITSSDHNQDSEIIPNPANPAEYTYEGQFYYSPFVTQNLTMQATGNHIWAVQMSAFFENDTMSEQFTPCLVDLDGTRNRISVPHSTIMELEGIARSRGIDTQRSPTIPDMIRFHNIDDETLSSLPTLNFRVLGENDTDIHIATMTPQEYTERDGRDPSMVTVLLRGAPEYLCTLHSRVVSGLALHFDTSNNRLGFGDAIQLTST